MEILIIRNGRAGDMVMCTPGLTALHEYFPQATFSFLTSGDGKRLLKDFSGRIAQFWIYNRGSVFHSFKRKTLRRQMERHNFDLIFNMEWNPRYEEFYKNMPGKVFRICDSAKPGEHYAQSILNMVSKAVGKDVGFYPTRLGIQDEAMKKTLAYLAAADITENTFLIAFHPTFSGINKFYKFSNEKTNKLWPAERFGQLGIMLGEYAVKHGKNLKVAMNLMPDELNVGRKILASARGGVTMLCPKPDIHTYLAFLKRTNLFVTPDTGPMHMAAAVGTPLVALFAGKDPGDCGPFAKPDQFTVLRAENTANPRLGLAALSVQQVFDACVASMESAAR